MIVTVEPVSVDHVPDVVACVLKQLDCGIDEGSPFLSSPFLLERSIPRK